MLPLQITLDGFLSYRDSTTLSFEGASLWMLAGSNGAGKSSVFDAMRWTLFGAHRGGKSGHEALIHHHKERLRVAFDLELGEKRFRLIRTLARAGRSTWQIEELIENQTEKVPETDGREGFEKWVREHIGLSDETFCTAMYLAQNRGDAILGASAPQRYEMLAEIVDISAYAALHETARTRASEWESASRAAEKSWQLAPEAQPDEILISQEKLKALNAQIDLKSARREAILGLEPLAAQWKKLESERQIVHQELESARVLLADAPQIERDFARLGELETLLPPLASYVETRARAAHNERESALCAAGLEAARALEARWKAQSEASQLEINHVENGRQKNQKARLATVSQSAALAPRLFRARQIARYRAEIAALERELSAFPADINNQKSDLEARIARAQDELAASAIWRRFAREHATYQSARADELAAHAQGEHPQTSLSAMREQLEKSRLNGEAARQNQTRAVELFAATTTRRGDAQSAGARFESVQGETNCHFCGQQLTPEHAQKERNRLENALQKARKAEADAQIELQNADQAAKNAQRQLENGQKELRDTENALQNCIKAQENAQNAATNALHVALAIFDELSEDWQKRLERANSDGEIDWPSAVSIQSLPSPVAEANDWATGAESLSPRAAENEMTRVLRILNGDASALPQWETPDKQLATIANWRLQLQTVAAQETEKIHIATRLGDRQNQLAPLLKESPDAAEKEDLDALGARESALQAALEAIEKGLQASETALQRARESAADAQGEYEAAREARARFDSQLAALGAAQIEIERALQSLRGELLAPFLERDEAALRAELERFKNEKREFYRQDLSARLAKLREAQNRVAQLETEVEHLQKDWENVPVAARRAPQELRAEAETLKSALEADGAAQTQWQLETSRLEARREEKSRLESAHRDAQNAARQHKTLADLLGPHQLQRFLLREAENGIVDEANAVLDRISGGGLRLELRADDEEIAGARKGVPKVLDLAIFRADEADSGPARAMLPTFLSGSQRFRVAVALALGIGRYATRGGGTRLEAVIIDEGFGSLDKIGRGEMIDELQLLGQELRRVILVSHQEEFFEAFPNRYLIENNGETSSAHLMAS